MFKKNKKCSIFIWKVNNILKMDIEYENPILFVRFKGTIDKRVAYRINNYLVSLLKKHNIKYLICNLTNLQNIDISGMEALVNLKCIIKNNKGKMYLCGLNSKIEKYLKPLKINKADNEFLAVELLGA